jgi:hypothetical protein
MELRGSTDLKIMLLLPFGYLHANGVEGIERVLKLG